MSNNLPFDPNINYATAENSPTIIDVLNAANYANNKIQIQICKDYSDKYTWKSSVPTYFCPPGLNCQEGTTEFTKKSCEQISTLPYEDCKRDVNGLCDYIRGANTDPINQWIPPQGIKGGISGEPIELSGTCKNTPSIKCTKNSQCTNNTKSQDSCDIPFTPYTEWREKDFNIGQDTYPGGKCYIVPSQIKKWCEMPWTRQNPTKQTNPRNKDSKGKTLKQPKTTDVPPYYYDNKDGTCHTTKTYCNNMSQKFGKESDFLFFSSCPIETDKVIDTKSDCCTNFGSSVGQIFLGKTLDACIKDLTQCDNKLMDFYCDVKLKKNIKLLKNFFPGVNIYLFEWNEEASRLYGLKGKKLGFMSYEIKKIFPDIIKNDNNNYEYIDLDNKKHFNNKDFKKLTIFMNLTKNLNKKLN